jgi:hypothetical protein
MKLAVLHLFRSTFRLAMPAKAKQLAATTLCTVTNVVLMTMTACTLVSSLYVTNVILMTMTMTA